MAKLGKKRRVRGIESKKSLYGRMFVLPWEIGIILFFLVPIGQSIWYSFTEVWLDPIEGITTYFTGLENFKYILNEDPKFVDNLTTSLTNFTYSLPIIVIVSFIFAVVLNQKFKGRVLFRSLYFLPVIIATGVVMEFLTQSVGGNQNPIIQLSTDASNAYVSGGIDFEGVLNSLNFPAEITELMAKYINMIFNLLWDCGVQIVLFIAGLQTIPEQLYEVSKVEGATSWEEFWYITLPMVSNTLLLVIIYTIIDLLTKTTDPVMTQAYNLMNMNQNYYHSSAMMWMFFAIVGVITAAVLFLYNRICARRWN
ncbi:MAG: sugar ABC transporter permease [Clostridia bacterium]|nr:sugar ABC transporter permease [Clostridia bacterium]MBR3594286.1 sugar ABC transporter permease [Clostridia bacterium]